MHKKKRPDTSAPECVVLLHGLGRSSKSFLFTSWLLRRAGFQTHCIDYPSRDFAIDKLVEQLDLLRFFDGQYNAVHFVTHSMGGILLRAWLQSHKPPRLGRIVMLAPPNRDSALIDLFSDFAAFEWFMGPAGMQLGTDKSSKPNSLSRIDGEVGIIAGTQSFTPFSKTLVGQENDGKVTVESTRIEEMKDHITMPVDHTFMMNNPKVVAEIITFLSRGEFSRSFSTASAIQFLAARANV